MNNLIVKAAIQYLPSVALCRVVLMVITLGFGETPFFSLTQCKLDFHSKQRKGKCEILCVNRLN